MRYNILNSSKRKYDIMQIYLYYDYFLGCNHVQFLRDDKKYCLGKICNEDVYLNLCILHCNIIIPIVASTSIIIILPINNNDFIYDRRFKV